MNRQKNLIGAQIMDDPIATKDLVDHWFKLLSDYHMPLARIFIPNDESQLFRTDWFFQAAEKYQVSITATLGGTPSPRNVQWIKTVVERYKNSPALDSWILVNEPGRVPEPTEQVVGRYRDWLKEKYKVIHLLNDAWSKEYQDFDSIQFDTTWMGGKAFSPPALIIDWYTFWRSHLTWELQWIFDQIRQSDPFHPTHVNPHALVSNLARISLDLPAWRSFLDSYGASCHPSWHFTLLKRDQYALGVAYVCDLIRGAAGEKPFWLTELQGGNNTLSGARPFYPTQADIAQWMWTAIGCGAERIIFWLLNNRSLGGESGEWSLLDFQHQPSERLECASRVSRILHQQSNFFQNAQPVESRITILLSLESMTLQERFERTQPVNSTEWGVSTRLEARGRNAHLLAVLAYYRIFQEMGLPVQIKHMHDYDWSGVSDQPRMVILANAVALNDDQVKLLGTFIKNGNTALITGLSGIWDVENRFMPLQKDFPLAQVTGATLKEIRTLEPGAFINFSAPPLQLPVDGWVGDICNFSATPIGSEGGQVTAVRTRTGAGEVTWIPSLIDLVAWKEENGALFQLVDSMVGKFIDLPGFRFEMQQSDCILRVLRFQNDFVTVLTNGSNQPRHLRLVCPANMQVSIIWSEGSSLKENGEAHLTARGTVVARWISKA